MDDDWSIGESWFDDHRLEVHFELLNSNNDRLLFALRSITIDDHPSFPNDGALDNFQYAEEQMLSMACGLVNNGHYSDEGVFNIKKGLFNRYYSG